MATSGTTAFNMDFTEIAEEAWERAGRELRSGYDLRTARRSMNLMTIEWPEETGASVEGKERMELEKMDDQLELQSARMRAAAEADKARNRE